MFENLGPKARHAEQCAWELGLAAKSAVIVGAAARSMLTRAQARRVGIESGARNILPTVVVSIVFSIIPIYLLYKPYNIPI